jgi:hypothetical protein
MVLLIVTYQQTGKISDMSVELLMEFSFFCRLLLQTRLSKKNIFSVAADFMSVDL